MLDAGRLRRGLRGLRVLARRKHGVSAVALRGCDVLQRLREMLLRAGVRHWLLGRHGSVLLLGHVGQLLSRHERRRGARMLERGGTAI